MKEMQLKNTQTDPPNFLASTRSRKTLLVDATLMIQLRPFKVTQQACLPPPAHDVRFVRCCFCFRCYSNCRCCCFASGFTHWHTCLLLLSNMPLGWQVAKQSSHSSCLFLLPHHLPLFLLSSSPLWSLWDEDDDDDTSRNLRMLRSWHDARSRNPHKRIRVSLLHSAAINFLTCGEALMWRKDEARDRQARWGKAWPEPISVWSLLSRGAHYLLWPVCLLSVVIYLFFL